MTMIRPFLLVVSASFVFADQLKGPTARKLTCLQLSIVGGYVNATRCLGDACALHVDFRTDTLIFSSYAANERRAESGCSYDSDSRSTTCTCHDDQGCERRLQHETLEKIPYVLFQLENAERYGEPFTLDSSFIACEDSSQNWVPGAAFCFGKECLLEGSLKSCGYTQRPASYKGCVKGAAGHQPACSCAQPYCNWGVGSFTGLLPE